MTVAELIRLLQTMDQDLVVEMAMNEEYQCPVDHTMVHQVVDHEGRVYLQIGD